MDVLQKSEAYYSSCILEEIRKREEEINNLLIQQNIQYEIRLTTGSIFTANPFLNWISNFNFIADEETLSDSVGMYIPVFHKNKDYIKLIKNIINDKLRGSYFVCKEVISSEMYISFSYEYRLYNKKTNYCREIQVYTDCHENDFRSGVLDEEHEFPERINFYEDCILNNKFFNPDWPFGENCFDRLLNYSSIDKRDSKKYKNCNISEQIGDLDIGYDYEPSIGADIYIYTKFIPVFHILEIDIDYTKNIEEIKEDDSDSESKETERPIIKRNMKKAELQELCRQYGISIVKQGTNGKEKDKTRQDMISELEKID